MVCTSKDPRDNRLRCSALVRTDSRQNILIDCGPDFRQQMLQAGSPDLDAVLLTHVHYDHVGGIDDMRPYCGPHPNFPVYCQPNVAADLRARIPYSFSSHLYPGVPTFALHEIDDTQPFMVGSDLVTPLPVMHTKTMRITGYRIGPLSYITDCKALVDGTLEKMAGTDTLVINALRLTPHPSHMNLQQALDVIRTVRPRVAYLTHLCHQMGLHASVEPLLPDNVRIAFDGLTVHTP